MTLHLGRTLTVPLPGREPATERAESRRMTLHLGRTGTMEFQFTETSYQTAPLAEYITFTLTVVRSKKEMPVPVTIEER